MHDYWLTDGTIRLSPDFIPPLSILAALALPIVIGHLYPPDSRAHPRRVTIAWIVLVAAYLGAFAGAPWLLCPPHIALATTGASSIALVALFVIRPGYLCLARKIHSRKKT